MTILRTDHDRCTFSQRKCHQANPPSGVSSQCGVDTKSKTSKKSRATLQRKRKISASHFSTRLDSIIRYKYRQWPTEYNAKQHIAMSEYNVALSTTY